VPVTSAIIAGLSRNKGWLTSLGLSVLYVFGLSIVYAVAGLAAGALGAQVQSFLSSAYVRVPIAAVFILLALSMFDVLIIQVPQSLRVHLAPAGGERSGLGPAAAAFGMGMVSGLVAGPCVAAPLFAVLTHIATVGSRLYGFWMLFALAWGMGVLLIAAGTAPGLVPKAGAWMVWLKKLFGFVMLWAAVYFLSSLLGDALYKLATAVLIVTALVFLRCFDSLGPDSGTMARLSRVLGILGLALAVGLGAGGAARLLGVSWSPQAPPASAFRPASASDLHAALASGNPAVIDFWADYCAICKKLDKTVVRGQRLKDALQGVAALKIDVEQFPEIASRYRVTGVPLLVFVDSSGAERLDLRSGAPDSVEDLLDRIARLKSPSPAARP